MGEEGGGDIEAFLQKIYPINHAMEYNMTLSQRLKSRFGIKTAQDLYEAEKMFVKPSS